MRKSISNKIIIAFCVAAIATGCKARKQMTAAPVTAVTPATIDTKAAKIAEIKANQLAFNTFSARAETELGIDDDSKNVVLNVRIDKDKKIWVSVNVTVLITIEAARALITPDSIKVLNKLQGVYLKKPFSYIHQYASTQVNYKAIESILTGNAMPQLLTENADIQADGGDIKMSGSMQDLLFKLIFGPELKVNQFNLANQQQTQTLQVNNTDFVQVANRVIPSRIILSSKSGGKKVQAKLHYTKIDLDQPLDYPFNIPESYTPAN